MNIQKVRNKERFQIDFDIDEEINEYCQKLPRYKRPKKVIFAEVPRNATGKIEKPALRKKYGAEHLVAQQNLA